MNYSIFTSESVCAGHPDKICDQISDAILDEALRQDPMSKTAIETVVKDRVMIVGEIKTSAKIDFEDISRRVIKRLGYTNPVWGFDASSPIEIHVNQQSPEIAIGTDHDMGAGDQGMMFGYACRETENFMPMPISLAHKITKNIDLNRLENKAVEWLLPDGKAQVTVRYQDGVPVAAEKVVVAVACDKDYFDGLDERQIVSDTVRDIIVLPVFGDMDIEPPKRENIIVNGTGKWNIPGPASDAGLTGRKIVVDSYGGYSRVGGGAFSGKDPSKVDRSAAYAARYLAKNIVAAGLADRCEVALAYCIGQPRPVMQAYETFGGRKSSLEEIKDFADNLLDTSVAGIIEHFKLRRPIYEQTASYGHFGRDDFPWEKLV